MGATEMDLAPCASFAKKSTLFLLSIGKLLALAASDPYCQSQLDMPKTTKRAAFA